MSDKTGIEWTGTFDENGTLISKGATWNPIGGCSRVSEGCRNCYAERMAARFSGPGQPYEGLAEMTPEGPRWTGEVRVIHDKLDQPIRWRRPRRIFVNSMSDLFHESLRNEEIAAVFGVIAASPQHTFQILTKRPERMRDWFEWMDRFAMERRAITAAPSKRQTCLNAAFTYLGETGQARRQIDRHWFVDGDRGPWPLPNVWLGVSVEDQATADERIPLLLDTPAAVRFVSAEPLLGPVMLDTYLGPLPEDEDGAPYPSALDWIIVGGESGPGARPMDPEWARSLRDQCAGAGVAFFMKQMDKLTPIPDDLMVREFPRSAVSA